MDGELVCEKQVKDVYIQFKTTKDGSIGFVLSDGSLGIDNNGQKYYDGEVYYTSSNIDEEQPQQPFFPLSSYIRYLDAPIECEKIELSEILNEEYLKKAVIQTSPNEMCSSSTFDTLFYNSTTNTIEMHPDYVICMERYILMENIGNTLCCSSLNQCYFYNGVVYFGKYTISEDIGVSYEGNSDISSDSESNDTPKIYFEEVLRYFGMFGMLDPKTERYFGLLESKTEIYKFTEEEMCDLYRQYISELIKKDISNPIKHGR